MGILFSFLNVRRQLLGQTFSDVVGPADQLTGADVQALCRDAALIALRKKRRHQIVLEDFKEAKEAIMHEKAGNETTQSMYL